MRAIPEDLEALNREIGERSTFWPNSSNPGWAVAFLRICKALEPNLVFSNDDDRRDWLKGVGAIEFNLPKFEIGQFQKDLPIRSVVFRDLHRIAKHCWRGPASAARELPFIKDSDLRRIAERDLSSLTNAQKTDEAKSAIILAGSVIEAVLWDVIEGQRAKDPSGTEAKAASAKTVLMVSSPKWRGFNPKDDEWWTLEQIIGVCGPNGLQVLAERTVGMAHIVRDYRNLVHPRKEREEEKSAGPLRSHDAVGAVALMEGVIDQVDRWHALNP